MSFPKLYINWRLKILNILLDFRPESNRLMEVLSEPALRDEGTEGKMKNVAADAEPDYRAPWLVTER